MPGITTCTNTKATMSAADTQHWLENVVVPVADKLERVGFFACLPDLVIPLAVNALRDSGIRVGAQDAWDKAGNATGETPASLLRETGCTHVMLGHADRRSRGETDELVARKTAAVHDSGLIPLVCVGESEPMTEQQAAETARAQLATATVSLPAGADVAVMYEPAWTIGAHAAPPGHVAAVCEILRQQARVQQLDDLALLYGGGVVTGTYTDLVDAGAAITGVGLGRVVRSRTALEEVLDELLNTPSASRG